MTTQKWNAALIVLATFLAVAARAHGATIGPLPYASIADSPFDPSQPGSGFVVEDFSHDLDKIPKDPASHGTPRYMIKLSTPGVIESSGEGSVSADGRYHAIGTYTDFANGTASVDLSFEFDATTLGGLPKDVGFAIGNANPITVNLYGPSGIVVDTLFSPSVPPPTEIVSGLENSITQALRIRFLGAINENGISRVTISAPATALLLDDVQYGQLTPEPSALLLTICGAMGVAVPFGRKTPLHQPKNQPPKCASLRGRLVRRDSVHAV